MIQLSTDTRQKMAITMIKKRLVMYNHLILLLIDIKLQATKVLIEVCYNLLNFISNILLLIIALDIYIGHDNYDRKPDDSSSSY